MKTTSGAAQNNSEADRRIVMTSGEIFSDNTLIELVEPFRADNLQLLYWSGERATIAKEINYQGHLYGPAQLDPTIRKAMPFSGAAVDYGERKMLFQKVADLFQRYIGFDGPEAKLLVLWVFSTWVPDCLPSPPVLLVSSIDTGHVMKLFRLLRCLCRHPLTLADISRTSLLRTLPMSLCPTLLLYQPDLPEKTVTLLCNSNHHGLVVPGNNGTVLNIACPKAIFTGMNVSSQEWGDQTVHLNVPPAHPDLQQLDDREQEKITNELQPLLLMYRLRNVHRVRDVIAGPPAFAGLELARNLLACVPDEPEVAQAVVTLLQSQEQDLVAQRSNDLTWVIVEVLWSLVHESRREVSVAKVAALANTILRTRGELLEYSAADVGRRLKALGITRHKGRNSMVLQFSRALSWRVHQLARDFNLQLPHAEKCVACTPPQTVAG
jgi:hypothetical protein